MTSNEALRLAFQQYSNRHPELKRQRKKFSVLLNLPVTEEGRTPTLDKWLVSDKSQNFRKCPDQVARLARLLVLLEEALPTLEMAQPLPDNIFYKLENIIKGKPYAQTSKTH